MAVAAGDITEFGKSPIGNGFWQIWFKYTGPASYTSGGESLTKAVCRAAMEGISEIEFLTAAPAGGSSYATGSLCTFEPTNTSTETGQFHFLNAVDAHLHTFIVKAGTAAAGTDTMNIKGASGSAVIGKEEATEKINPGGATAGGVQNSTAAVTAAEAAAASNFSAQTCWFYGLGKM